jgi:flagellar motility protein MotE (MotC chaperone)
MKRKGSKSRPTRGSLLLIAGFLLGSGLWRIGFGAGEVLALEGADDMAVTPAALPVVAETCEPPPDLRRLMDVLAAREARIDRREREIEDRAQALAVADEQMTEQLQILIAAEAELRATIALANQAAEQDLSQLTKVYETMQPKEAAALFEEMEPEFAAGFLGRMEPASAAGVMAKLSPEAAYTISVVLAGRNALVPTE